MLHRAVGRVKINCNAAKMFLNTKESPICRLITMIAPRMNAGIAQA
jgi:hypothetical protein